VGDLLGGSREEGTPQTGVVRGSEDLAEDAPITASRLRQALSAVTMDIHAQQQEMLQQFTRLVESLTAARRDETAGSSQQETRPVVRSGNTVLRSSTETPSTRLSPAPRLLDGGAAGCPIKWLAAQIPEFGGSEDENVVTWTRRIDKVALIHGATDAAMLLAASSRLTNNTRKWYDVQSEM